MEIVVIGLYLDYLNLIFLFNLIFCNFFLIFAL